MKKRNGIKAGMIGLALLSAGATIAVPMAIPQTAVTAEAASYDIYRYIKVYYKNADGTTQLYGTAERQLKVPSPTKQYTFDAEKASDIFAAPDGWKYENEDIPPVKGSYNNPPEEYKVYLVRDEEALANAVTLNRKINIYKKYSDGTTKFIGETGPYYENVVDKDKIYNFAETNATDYLKDYDNKDIWGAWVPEQAKVPAASGSYNNPPAEYDLYLVIDSSQGITSDKTVKRTIKYYTVDASGKKVLIETAYDSVTFRAGTSNTEQYKLDDVNVKEKTGYTADKSVVVGRTVTPTSKDFTEEVVYTKNANVTTESKTVYRKINFIDKDTGKKIKGSESKGVKFTREVIKDTNGNVTQVVRDWQESGTIDAFTVPDIEGYSHKQKVVPAVTVKPTDKDIEVNVEYLSTRFTVNYHIDDTAAASSKKTVVNYGEWTNTLTLSELGFNKPGYTFKGWRAYREIDDTWYLQDGNGNKKWMKVTNGQLPEGWNYHLYKNGQKVMALAKRGNTHFYGQWNANTFTVNYHLDDNASASSKKTVVTYGEWTNTLTLSELGFNKPGYTFKGWRAYREIDDTWYLQDGNGNKKWMKVTNGQLPEGWNYHLYKSGQKVMALAKTGNAHFYGQWYENKFTVNYHLDDNSGASSKKTVVTYGEWTNTLTISELGFKKTGKTFAGWRAYREIDDTWYLKDGSGNKKWMKVTNGQLPEGWNYYLYKSGQKVKALTKTGNAHFYGQWK